MTVIQIPVAGGGGGDAAYIFANTLHVADNAPLGTGVIGNINKPFTWIEALNAATNNQTILMWGGTYTAGFTIDTELGGGVTDVNIITLGEVTVNSTVGSLVSDSTGKSYTMSGDFIINGHGGAPLFNFAHANSNITIRARKLTNDGDYISFATGGSSTIQWDFMQISNAHAIEHSGTTMKIVCGDVDGSVLGSFYRPSFGCFDTIEANPRVGVPVVLVDLSAVQVAGSASVLDREPIFQGIIFVNTTTALVTLIYLRRNSRLEFTNCLFVNNTNGLHCAWSSSQSTTLPMGFTFEDCEYINNGTTAGDGGIDISNLPVGSVPLFELLLKGTNLFSITNATGLSINHDTAIMNTFIEGYAGGNKDVGATVNQLVGSFDFNVDVRL